MAEAKWRYSDGQQPPPEAINSSSSVTQTLSGEVADGQRKLIALAAARGNSSAVNPLVTQLTNGPLGGLHLKFMDSMLLQYI
ncbi:hypothetical protein ACFX13_006320 [Malus domestica]